MLPSVPLGQSTPPLRRPRRTGRRRGTELENEARSVDVRHGHLEHAAGIVDPDLTADRAGQDPDHHPPPVQRVAQLELGALPAEPREVLLATERALDPG